MATSEHRRRALDAYGFDIDALIQQEDDLKQRTFLIVMNNINLSLISNTQAVTDLRAEFGTHLANFQEHAAREERIFNQGRGMWRIISFVIAAVQVIFGYGWMQMTDHLKSIDNFMTISQLNDAKQDQRWIEHDRKK